jgi:hypothetical protein
LIVGNAASHFRRESMRNMSKYSLILVLIIFFGFTSEAQTTQSNTQSKTFRSPFRYVIVSNKSDPAISRKDENRRFVEVLLDGKSFSKENLIALFKLVSRRFPKPNLLYVNLFTSLEDIETPEEREQGKFSDSDDANASNQSDSAVFIRNGNKMFFYLYAANGDFEEVEIK